MKRKSTNSHGLFPHRPGQWTLVLAAAMAAHSAAQGQLQGPSSSATPYLLPTDWDIVTKSILTVGDSVNLKPDGVTPYRMVGIPDGLGAYDNGDGTFTALMNHELGATAGVPRAHGATGAFVSQWIIDKSSLQVLHGQDLVQQVSLWNGAGFDAPTTGSTSPFQFGRLCSADLPAPTAFFDSLSGLGTSERIFMNGEESGAEGRAFAHIASGPNAGTTYQLPHLGRFSWENSVANPAAQAKTIVVGLDDTANQGQVYMYVGQKQNAGNEIEKAGLVGGNLFGIKVGNSAPQAEDRNAGFDGVAGNKDSLPFTLVPKGNVANQTGVQLNANSAANGVSEFLRPEDGAWDPANPNTFYFVTTDRFDQVKAGTGAQVGKTRLYRLQFTDIANPENGGQLDMILNGDEAGQMFDNISVQNGKIMLQEDPGNVAHLGKVFEYDIASGTLRQIAQHDPARFSTPTAPFSRDEESSGVIDISDIIGGDQKTYLVDVQAHYGIGGELVEGGQLLTLTVVPEASTTIAGMALLSALAGGWVRRNFRKVQTAS